MLGVTPRRVRAMIADGMLPALRLGHQWVVPLPTLRAFDHNRLRHPGRPMSQRAAWRKIADLDRHGPGGQPLDELRRRLRARAVHSDGYVHPGALRSLLTDLDVIRGGLDAAGIPEDRTDLDLYVRRSRVDQVRSHYRIIDDGDALNVHLHVVDDDAWPFSPGPRRASQWVGWLDLADRRDRNADVVLDRLRGRLR